MADKKRKQYMIVNTNTGHMVGKNFFYSPEVARTRGEYYKGIWPTELTVAIRPAPKDSVKAS